MAFECQIVTYWCHHKIEFIYFDRDVLGEIKLQPKYLNDRNKNVRGIPMEIIKSYNYWRFWNETSIVFYYLFWMKIVLLRKTGKTFFFSFQFVSWVSAHLICTTRGHVTIGMYLSTTLSLYFTTWNRLNLLKSNNISLQTCSKLYPLVSNIVS